VRDGLALLGGLSQPLAVAMSGSGPSLFALFRSLDQARDAQAALAPALATAGFESWCCTCRSGGVTLEP